MNQVIPLRKNADEANLSSVTPACDNCKFFGARDSVCRRYPPVRIAVTTQQVEVFGFPLTHHSSWCGEYQGRVITGVPYATGDVITSFSYSPEAS